MAPMIGDDDEAAREIETKRKRPIEGQSASTECSGCQGQKKEMTANTKKKIKDLTSSRLFFFFFF